MTTKEERRIEKARRETQMHLYLAEDHLGGYSDYYGDRKESEERVKALELGLEILSNSETLCEAQKVAATLGANIWVGDND